MARKLTPYEKNHLLRHGHTDFDIQSETPVEYRTGFAEFYKRDFLVDKNVLIPRIETEEIIDLVLSVILGIRRLAETPESLSTIPRDPGHLPAKASVQAGARMTEYIIADVGTGSGCIGITLFLELEKLGINSIITLSDISSKALKVAASNATHFSISRTKLHLIYSDLLTSYPATPLFDIIIANLPYVPSPRLSSLAKSVKDFEPKIALDGGLDGLIFIKKLLKKARLFLKCNGCLILEIDKIHQLSDFKKFTKNYKLEIKKDQFGRNRFLIAKPLALLTKKDLQHDKIIIQ